MKVKVYPTSEIGLVPKVVYDSLKLSIFKMGEPGQFLGVEVHGS